MIMKQPLENSMVACKGPWEIAAPPLERDMYRLKDIQDELAILRGGDEDEILRHPVLLDEYESEHKPNGHPMKKFIEEAIELREVQT